MYVYNLYQSFTYPRSVQCVKYAERNTNAKEEN